MVSKFIPMYYTKVTLIINTQNFIDLIHYVIIGSYTYIIDNVLNLCFSV